MDSPVFVRLQDTLQHPSTRKEWCVFAFRQRQSWLTALCHRFSMAEQALNTIYGLGDQPDALCSVIIREMTSRVFGPRPVPAPVAEEDDEPMLEDDAAVEGEADVDDSKSQAGRAPSAAGSHAKPKTQLPAFGNAFQLSQLIFVAGHCAIKQLVHLEIVERDIKRRKAEEDKKAGAKSAGQDELDQVAGSVEDDIGDVIAHAKETELLYGPQSLLAVFGPMAATIVGFPKVYRVRSLASSH